MHCKGGMLGVLLGWMGELQKGLGTEIYEIGTKNIKQFLGVFLAHRVPILAVFMTALISTCPVIKSSL